ncbi:hypothetical protein [Clostridium sporogenes]|uniref:hypothetical protein n=1 Tax=Clostridium sporogenes TaxID=1509 RepID=UPI0015EE8EBE|nr:hypothetical protein [Clostridium sporogenes]MBA4507960.1 hypothetical protein [Clostridium sporogenes]MCW6108705.1 hypothetical protein [Clostridium sporogenes]
MEILVKKLFELDRLNNQVISREVNTQDVKEYIDEVISKMVDKKDSRKYIVKDESTQVISGINKIISGITIENDNNMYIAAASENGLNYVDSITKSIALRLLEKEEIVNEKIERTKREVKKGSFLFAISKISKKESLKGAYLAYLSKIEHARFLDLSELVKKIGLPFSKIVHRSCIIYYDDNLEIQDIELLDSNSTLAVHWWDYFLELKEATSDYTNTENSYNGIKTLIDTNFKSKSEADHFQLINNLKSFYSTKKSFKYDEAVEYIVGSYEPVNKDINIKEFKERLQQLPSVANFDRNFNIDIKPIKKKLNQKIKVNDKINLDLKEGTKNVRHFLKAYQEPDGTKYLKILDISNEAYNRFKDY